MAMPGSMPSALMTTHRVVESSFWVDQAEGLLLRSDKKAEVVSWGVT